MQLETWLYIPLDDEVPLRIRLQLRTPIGKFKTVIGFCSITIHNRGRKPRWRGIALN